MRVRQLQRRTTFPYNEEVTFIIVGGKRTRVVKFTSNGAPVAFDFKGSWASFDLDTDAMSLEFRHEPLTPIGTSGLSQWSGGNITSLMRTRGSIKQRIGYYGVNTYYASETNAHPNNIFLSFTDTFGLEFDPDLSTLAPNRRPFYGAASPPPPPPPPKKKMCCDCNTIATIIESQMLARDKLFEDIKNHIDQRITEEIAIHGKQLEALEVDLQPVIDRINESESNLWNGKQR